MYMKELLYISVVQCVLMCRNVKPADSLNVA